MAYVIRRYDSLICTSRLSSLSEGHVSKVLWWAGAENSYLLRCVVTRGSAIVFADSDRLIALCGGVEFSWWTFGGLKGWFVMMQGSTATKQYWLIEPWRVCRSLRIEVCELGVGKGEEKAESGKMDAGKGRRKRETGSWKLKAWIGWLWALMLVMKVGSGFFEGYKKSLGGAKAFLGSILWFGYFSVVSIFFFLYD